MKKLIIPIFLLLFILGSCKNEKYHYNSTHILSVLYNETSAEYTALCLQTFNMAQMLLDRDLKTINLEKPAAVIVDVDETILNNSPYEAQIILDKKDYPYLWDKWCKDSSAKPLEGAVEFLKYAESKGVEVFYVTNRKKHLKSGTLDNLKKFGFPYADKKHIYTRIKDSSKEGRRQEIMANYNVLLLMGDNLADFSNVFENQTIARRNEEVRKFKEKWGNKFMILPNPMYGDWENSIYDYHYDLKNKQKLEILLKELKGVHVK
ncbi:5'-nucleotidase, lipoprotein e(P4) family [bacterium]|nr:5'-nucleotidase, lipoprotein e(P4) family [bacterium]